MTKGIIPGPLGHNKYGGQDVIFKPGPLGHKGTGTPRPLPPLPPEPIPSCPTARGLRALEYFPVYYPPGYNRNSINSVLRRGERTFVIFFENSFRYSRASGPHDAIDIMTPIGLPVYLTSPQAVVNEWLPGGGSPPRPGAAPASIGGDGGNSVRTIDERGFIHYYSHLDGTPLVTDGVTYDAGTLIGHSGDSGNARGNAHLHYQIRRARPVSRVRYTMEIGGRRYDTKGGAAVNPYCELVRLCRLLRGSPRTRGNARYYLPQLRRCYYPVSAVQPGTRHGRRAPF